MAVQKGKELLLKIHDGSDYQLVGGFKSNDIDIKGGTAADITTKDSGGFTELLEEGAIKSLSTTGNGVFMNDAAFALAHGHAMAGTHPDCQIVIPGFGTYTGKFMITSLKLDGSHDGAVTYSITLDSAGPVAFA